MVMKLPVESRERGAYLKGYYDAKMNNEAQRGKWIEENDIIVHGHCSSCGWNAIWQETDVFGMPYCPNCGSRMDLDGDEDE